MAFKNWPQVCNCQLLLSISSCCSFTFDNAIIFCICHFEIFIFREFNRKRHMELHVLFKHTQERPFGCDQCGKRFKTRHCVNVHLRTHGVGGFSWCCEECGKTFNQISSYHTHLKVKFCCWRYFCVGWFILLFESQNENAYFWIW